MYRVPHILYLVHDLADPAVRRRVSMLHAGGAVVTFGRLHPEPGESSPGGKPGPGELGCTS